MYKTAVPLSLHEFQSKFLPIPAPGPNVPRKPRPRDFSSILGLRTERQISEKFTKIVNGQSKETESLCPGFTIALSQDRWDPNDDNRLKVDGAFYPSSDVPRDRRPHWEHQRLLIEFKRGTPQNDPYRDIHSDDASGERQKVLGQLADYVQHALAYQQRTALFLLLIFGTKARMTRWDRSGTIYTDAFDYVEKPDKLRDILWGFSQLSPEKQGLDPTATPVEPGTADYDEMNLLAEEQPTDISEEEGTHVPTPTNPEAPMVFAYVRKLFAQSLSSEWPRWKLSIRKGKETRSFLVAEPVFRASGVVGRGTRGYVAVDCKTKAFVWLKDTWRPNYPGVTPEGEVLEMLRGANVQNIPTLVFHGDLNQDTHTPQYAKATRRSNLQKGKQIGTAPSGAQPFLSLRGAANGAEPRRTRKRTRDAAAERASGDDDDGDSLDVRLRHLRHYRLVVSEVCLPLHEFTCGRELLSIVRDCVTAHRDAAISSHRMLHRDISIGNLLIYPTLEKQSDGSRRVVRRGILTDWELAKSLCDDPAKEVQRQPERTGTWQFISVFSLDYPTVPMKIEDDIESYFHVLHYAGVRYLRHNCTNVSFYLTDFFDSYERIGKEYHCGTSKRKTMHSGKLVLLGNNRLTFFHRDNTRRHVLSDVLRTMQTWFHARYCLAESEPEDESTPFSYDVGLDPARIVMEQRAKRITDHTALLDLLDQALAKDWPTDDKVGDQVTDAPAPDPADPEADEDVEAAEGIAAEERSSTAERPAKRRAAGKTPKPSDPPKQEVAKKSNRKRSGYVRAGPQAQAAKPRGAGRPTVSRKKCA